MTNSFTQVLFCLAAGIILIVVLTAKYKVHPFFALLLACFVVGFGVEMSFDAILGVVKEGFGRILQSLGLIIVMGTTLGVLLEHSGCTKVMAKWILKRTGEKRAPLAMSITGFIVGLPVFCDSGFIVLSGLNQSLAKHTGISVVIMAVSMATGLYAVHCLIPPHPGPAAAGVTVGVDFGMLILVGIVVAIPGMIVGYLWAGYAGKRLPHVAAEKEIAAGDAPAPAPMMAFLPVVVPILLIAMNAFFAMEKNETGVVQKIFAVLGEPVVALSVGVLLVFVAMHKTTKRNTPELLQEAAEKAGGILVIIGAGGAFGAVLAATKIGEHMGATLDLESLGVFFPFLITSMLKTAQGSSTVAIITAAAIVQPLLPVLGLDSANGRLLCVLSMGAGSMMISHANDAYFWVISKFSGLDMRSMLRVYSIATIWMGLVTLAVVYVVALVVL